MKLALTVTAALAFCVPAQARTDYPRHSFPPPHASLWLCIHASEGAWHDRDSGRNGHYGGLQMHPGWGYGTSWHASEDTPLVQMWAAEYGYKASRYSHRWLQGQWGQTIGPCWRHA